MPEFNSKTLGPPGGTGGGLAAMGSMAGPIGAGIGAVGDIATGLIGAFADPGPSPSAANVGRWVGSTKDTLKYYLGSRLSQMDPLFGDAYTLSMSNRPFAAKSFYKRFGQASGKLPTMKDGVITTPGTGMFANADAVMAANPGIKSPYQVAAIMQLQEQQRRAANAQPLFKGATGGGFGYTGNLGSYNSGYGGPLG